MTALALQPALPAMSQAAIDLARRMTEQVFKLPQVPLKTEHAFHAGLYARTIRVPAQTILPSALIRIPTLVILEGHAEVYIGEAAPLALKGYNVLPASAGRKLVYVTHSLVNITMLFATDATTVEAAEREFTDEYALLGSRREGA